MAFSKGEVTQLKICYEKFLNSSRKLETDPSEVGFDRAQYLLLIGTEYRRTIALLLRRVDSEMEHAIDAHHTHARGGISLDHVSVLQQSLRAILNHLNRLLTVYSSRLIENDNAA